MTATLIAASFLLTFGLLTYRTASRALDPNTKAVYGFFANACFYALSLGVVMFTALLFYN